MAIACCLFTFAARAQEREAIPSSDAEGAEAAYKRHLDIGIRLFEDRNYDAAMAEFERAYATQRRAGPLINIALCHKGRFEYVKAVALLERALREHRDTVRDAAAIEKGIAEMRELLGTLAVHVTPTSAKPRVSLDGEPVSLDAAGKPFEVSPGRHELVVTAPGFAEHRQELRVAPGDKLALDVPLQIDEGRLAVTSVAPGVTVSVDGQPRGEGSVSVRLVPGTHLLEMALGDDRYTVSFAVVRGETTKVALDEHGLLRVGDAAPRGPDLTASPPITGIYVLAVLDVGPRVGGLTDLRVAPGARLGYRVTSGIGIELEFHQALNVSESNEQQELVGSTVGRVNARLMTDTLPIRFVTTVGVGYAHDFDDEGSGNGINFLAEPAFDVELSQFIFGLATPVVVTFSSLSGSAVSFDFGGGLRAGYGFW